jgi:hypothetical protein
MSQETEDHSKRIKGILANCKDKGVNLETLTVFHLLLSQTLTLPCDVVSKADLERYVLYAIENSGDDMYGLLGKLRLMSNEKKKVVIPLCDLKAMDNRSIDYQLIQDYATWFVNSQF